MNSVHALNDVVSLWVTNFELGLSAYNNSHVACWIIDLFSTDGLSGICSESMDSSTWAIYDQTYDLFWFVG